MKRAWERCFATLPGLLLAIATANVRTIVATPLRQAAPEAGH